MSISYYQTNDNTKLALHAYPAISQKAVALFIAGIESHAGWYESSLNFLREQGVSAYFLDRRGSGKSEGKRGDCGSDEQLVSDVLTVTEDLKCQSDCPIVLCAISWGVKVALNLWFREGENPFQKLILITPGIFRKVDLPFHEKCLAAFSSVFSPSSLFNIPIPTEFFTNNSQYLFFLKNDRLRLKKVTARFLKSTFLLDRRIAQEKGVYPQPTFLFSSDGDKIVDNERNLQYLKNRFFDIKNRQYSRTMHTLEFEEAIHYKADLAEAILANF